MSSENSNFYLGKSHLIIASTILFFVLNLALAFIYTRYEVPALNQLASGLFSLAKTVINHSIFWLLAGMILKDRKATLAGLLISVALSGALGFYHGTLISYDADNLLLKSLVYLIPFYVFGVLKLKKIFLPLGFAFMGIIPIANLELGHRFISNLSFLSVKNLINLDFKTLTLNTAGHEARFLFGLPFDPLPVVVSSFLFLITLILFLELYRLLKGKVSAGLFKSHFNIKNSYSKPYALLTYVSVKTLIYYLIASITVIIMGNNNFPLLHNKIAQFIYLKGSVLLLIFCAVYFRKFLSEQLIPNKPFPFFVYLVSLFPVLDYFAWIFLMLTPQPHAMQNFRAENKTLGTFKTIAFLLFLVVQVAFILFFYFGIFKSKPLSDEVLNAGVTQVLVIPLLYIVLLIGAYFSYRTAQALFFFIIISLIYVGLKCLPLTETVFSLEFLSFDITKILVFIVISFCLIPVLHVRRFYK